MIRRRRRLPARLVTGLVATSLAVAALALPALADDTTASYDTYRTGWDPNESKLAPSQVSAADFGQLFATQLDGQVYAQPVVAKGTLLAVTENDKAYGMDPVTGAVRWTRDVGPAWPASAIGCGDLIPNIGATATPVVDPATGTAYFTTKVNDGADTSHPHWYMHAVDVTTGKERTGFPTTLGGHPTNSPTTTFNPRTAMQRPGLLLLGGVVYAGFASHCDYGPYVGYVLGVDAATGKQTALWSTEAGTSNEQAGIWQSGGGLMSDGAGRIFVSTGNGLSPAPSPGRTPPANLAESIIRLGVGADGSLTAKDFFSPSNNTNLDTDDTDFGSGGPVALPDGAFGTAAHPHLVVMVGKDGRVYLLDRDDLGGSAQGAGGTDKVLQKIGPYKGVWGHPGVWPGEGGYVYTIENYGPLRAFKYGVSGSGQPLLTSVGTSAGNWGYTSGSPVVTSDGTTSGSALVWAVYTSGPTGANAQLRAYDAVPVDGVLKQRYSAPIDTGSKFQIAGTDAGRVYVGSRSGKVYGFGRPTTVALAGSPTDFGAVPVGTSRTTTVTVTATRAVTVSAVSASGPFSTGAVTLPQSLTTGQKLAVPVTFAPTTAGTQSGALTFATSAGSLGFDLHGSATQAGLSATPASLDFGDVPVGGKVTLSVNVANTGATTETITGATPAAAPFASTVLPANGSTLAPGASVSIPITFAPTAAGARTGSVKVSSDAGAVSIPVTGNGVSGSPHMTLSPTSLDFGTVPVGQTVSRTFDLTNTGNLVLTISKAAPPTAPFYAPNPIPEGQSLEPGEDSVIHETIQFTPTAPGTFTGQYLVTGNDGQGAQHVDVKGVATAASGTVAPAPAAGGWSFNGPATQSGADTVLNPLTTGQSGNAIFPTPVTTEGLHVQFTAQIGGGTGGDGMTFALLDAAHSSATSRGRSGGALGFGGLTGVAVGLDTYKGGNDPSSNFVGIATGATGTNSDVLTWAATQAAATPLRTGTHLVDVTVVKGVLTVRLDGGLPLQATVAVPAQARLAFTASTGGVTDLHTVRGVSITRVAAPPAAGPSGAIVGLASKCMDVQGAKTDDGTQVQLYDCNATAAQTWTVGDDGTIRALGKCLTPKAGGTADGTYVQLFSCDGSAAQVWTARAGQTLLNGASRTCLDVYKRNPANNTRLQLWTCNGQSNQVWKLPA